MIQECEKCLQPFFAATEDDLYCFDCSELAEARNVPGARSNEKIGTIDKHYFGKK